MKFCDLSNMTEADFQAYDAARTSEEKVAILEKHMSGHEARAMVTISNGGNPGVIRVKGTPEDEARYDAEVKRRKDCLATGVPYVPPSWLVKQNGG